MAADPDRWADLPEKLATLAARVHDRGLDTVVLRDPANLTWLLSAVTAQRGNGRLSGVTTIQRLNTRGGTAGGSCKSAGTLLSIPYSADYAFWRKGG